MTVTTAQPRFGAAGASAPDGLVVGKGPVRMWRGLLVQSLDPVARGASATAASEARQAAEGPTRFAGEPLWHALSLSSDGPLPQALPLSNERTITFWAYAARLATVRTSPLPHAQAVSKLRWYTEDGFPENYLLLWVYRDAAGRDWVKLRIPMLPNGQVGWVPRDAIGGFHTTRDLLVLDRQRLCLEFFTDGQICWSAPVVVGGGRTPTPPGRFWIRQRFKIFDASSDYWPYAFGTADYSMPTDRLPGRVVGIYGSHVVGVHTSQLQSDALPAHPSDGCIRLRVADAAWLGRHLGLGTPLRVL